MHVSDYTGWKPGKFLYRNGPCDALVPGSLMLKITRTERRHSLTFVLEGRLCHPWTTEAQRCWLQLLSMAGNRKLWLDLAGVTFVDREGEALLASILERGTRVRASGLLVSHLVEQVQRKVLRR